MRTESGEPKDDSRQPEAEPEPWLVAELRSGMESWDPGSAAFDRVIRLGRQRRAARKRYAVTAGLAAVACALLVYVVFPGSWTAASTVAGSVAGGQTPAPSLGSPQPTASPSPTPSIATATSPPVIAQPAPRHTQTPTPPPGSSPVQEKPPPAAVPAATASPVTAGPRKSPSADPGASSPPPPGGPLPICILGLLCL